MTESNIEARGIPMPVLCYEIVDGETGPLVDRVQQQKDREWAERNPGYGI